MPGQMMQNLKKNPTEVNPACPNHGHILVPLHTVEGGARRVVGLTCPEPYCDHVRMLTRDEAQRFVDRRRTRGAGEGASAAIGG